MMQAVRNTIVSLEVPNEQISTEEFVSPNGNVYSYEQVTESQSGINSEKMHSTTVSFDLSSQSVEVDASTTGLKAAEQAGVTMP
jgi:ferredoxin-NADP reductase